MPKLSLNPPLNLENIPYFALLLIVFAWLVPGLVGHAPWKPDEAYTFGLVQHIIMTKDWTVPTLAGEPFMEKPPLFFISAALTQQWLTPWLSAPDAARIATGFWMIVTFAGLAYAAQSLYGHKAKAWAILLLLSCLGLTVRAHQMITDTALLAGFAWALVGLIRLPDHIIRGGIALGLGTTITFLSKGLLGPGCMGLTALLALCHPRYRSRYTFYGFGIALLFGLPLPLLWIGALYHRSSDLFWLWFSVNNFGRFDGSAHLGPASSPFFYTLTLPWYAFPVLPMAIYSGFWIKHNGQRIWHYATIPLIGFVVTLAILGLASDARELYAMPLLIPLALLAMPALQRSTEHTNTYPAKNASARFWKAIAWGLLFLALLTLGLLISTALALSSTHFSTWMIKSVRRFFDAEWRPTWIIGTWISFAAIALGVMLLWRRLHYATLAGCVWRWSLLITLAWGGVATLWLPAIDHTMSYQSAFSPLRPFFQDVKQRHECVASLGLGEPQRALLAYYANYQTQRLEIYPQALSCRWLLVQTLYDHLPSEVKSLTLHTTFARPGDKKERFWLFENKTLITKNHEN